ncbi:MAG: hypothetical protein NT124_01880 [Candidatus Dependentiae bacterium]|nr:hypothetical protein [Candidatus Dependentiae bacterium]
MLQETKKNSHYLIQTIISLGILIGFIGTPIPSRAAALDERIAVQQQFLKPSGLNQGGQKTFWLSTGQGATSDFALIALNHPQLDNIPRLDPDTLEANFSYVSDYLHPKTITYFKLPAGLYFWQSGTLQVRPHEKITYQSNKKTQCFAQVIKGTVSDKCFDATRNPFALGQNSQARAATIAHNQNPALIPLHPFDDDTWGAIITGKPAVAIGRPAVPAYAAAKPAYAAAPLFAVAQAVALPQGLTISIASSNVMSQGQYEHDFPALVKASHMLPLQERTSLFQAAFKDPKQLANKDFVMLQEFGLGMRDKDIALEQVSAANVRSLKFALAQVPEYESVAKVANSPGIVDLLFNKQKYDQLETLKANGISAGRYLGGVFQLKQHRQVKIGVVCAHIQYGPKGASQIRDLIKDIDTATQYHPDIAGWIVAGDYNIDYNNPAKDLRGMTGARFQDVAVGTNGAGGRLTALGKVQQKGGKHAPWNVSPEGIDYIWYRGNLQPTATGIYPAVADQNKRLLTGGNIKPDGTHGNDSRRDFFSDHAIVSATFAVGGPQMPQQPVQQQPALGYAGAGHAKPKAQVIACPLCTFENPMRSTKCEICDTPLAAAPRAQMPQQPVQQPGRSAAAQDDDSWFKEYGDQANREAADWQVYNADEWEQ